MKVVILGSGLQGTACAWDLVHLDDVESVLFVDQSEQALAKAKALVPSDKIQTQVADITKEDTAIAVMKQGDVTISAVPYFLNVMLTKCAIEAGCHFTDMGGNTDVVFEQMELTDKAKSKGITIVPDMGLAPGFGNLLVAELIEKFDSVDVAEVRVGGLPQEPKAPMNYQRFFSVEGLINEYIGDCIVLKDGQRETVKSLTDLETITFPEPIGECEAFNTLGGTSTLPWTYEGRVKHFNYKTVRYPGHCEQLLFLESLGMFDTNPIRTREGFSVPPRQVTAALMDRLFGVISDQNPRDYIVVRVTVKGEQNGELVEESFECLDKYDDATQFTAMMRMTAFPVAIVAHLLGSNQVPDKGVIPAERCIPHGKVREQMEKRGIAITHNQKAFA